MYFPYFRAQGRYRFQYKRPARKGAYIESDNALRENRV